MKDISKEAHQLRQHIDSLYAQNVEPTEVNGMIARSRLEALWIEQLSTCEYFRCVECVPVPLWIHGPYGTILRNYLPDIVIENADGKIFVELKPTTELALVDDRQKRALELNPHYKFVIIGGYPYQGRGVTVKLLTGTVEKVYKNVSVDQVLQFLGCA